MSTSITVHENIRRAPDGIAAEFGTDGDLSVKHSGTAGSITNATGNVTLQNTAVTGKIIHKLGTNDLNTSFEVQKANGTVVLAVDGAGTLSALVAGDTATTWTQNSDAAAGVEDGTAFILRDGDGGAEIINARFGVDASADLHYIRLDGGAGGVTRKSPTLVIGAPGETTVSMDSTIRLESATDAGVNKAASLVLRGQEADLTILAPGTIVLGDGTATLSMTAGAISTSSLASVSLTPSGNIVMTGASLDLDPTGDVTLDMDAGKNVTVSLSDNEDAALLIQEGANSYLEIDTQNAQARVIVGNATTNPTLQVLGTGAASFGGSVSAVGELINSRYVYAVVTAPNVAGSNDTTLTVQIKTLDGVNIAVAKKVRVIFSSVDGDNVADASVTVSAPTAGSIVASGTGYAEVLTDATGLFASTLTNSADETSYIGVVHSIGLASGGALSQGCLVVPGLMDAVTWAP